jgi:ketosteroid isomerase-like protein
MITKKSTSDIVRKCFSAWETGDRPALENLLAEDFTFTSPNDDDHINKAQYFKKCWPGSENINAFKILNLIEDGDEAFIRYECELKDGKRFRNTEYFRVEDGKIREVDVYFGRNV